MMCERPICLIPARGGSKRFPRKNVAPLKGKPLLSYSAKAAIECGVFSQVWVSTDDAEIATLAAQYGAKVHERPEALAGDQATLVQVALGFADWLGQQGEQFDVLAIVLPTAALLTPEDLRGGFSLFRERGADFVMAVTSYLESPFQALEEVVKKDRAKTHILPMSDFGLVELTRQRSRPSLESVLCRTCPICYGRGLIKAVDTLSSEIEREVLKLSGGLEFRDLIIRINPDLAKAMEEKNHFLDWLEKTYKTKITLNPDESLQRERYEIITT